jgi:hypothetical protein
VTLIAQCHDSFNATLFRVTKHDATVHAMFADVSNTFGAFYKPE